LRVAHDREERAEAHRYLDAAAARADDAGVRASSEIRTGDPVQEILAAEREGDLLVMTSHGATGFQRFLLGTVADRVLGYGRAPIFLARAFHPVVPVLSPILVPLDGSEQAETILPYVRIFARALDADLKVLRVVHVRAFDAIAYPQQIVHLTLEWERAEAGRYVERVVSELARDGFRAAGGVREAEPFEAITEASGEVEGGFIAMATHGRSGLARTLLGSLAARVSEYAPDPVLLLKI
jgi:nucleotide-binding universal stress UspA family protein